MIDQDTGNPVGTEELGYLWLAGRAAQGVTNAQRAVAQETVFTFDVTSGTEGEKDSDRWGLEILRVRLAL